MVHGKTIHAVQQIVSDFCSCCMFLWGENCVSWRWKAFTTCNVIECKKSLQKLSPQRIVPKSKAETGKQSFDFAHRSLWVNCVLRNNWQYCNLIGPYHISVTGPRIRLGSPDRFPCERCGLGMRLSKVVAVQHFTNQWLCLLSLPPPILSTLGEARIAQTRTQCNCLLHRLWSNGFQRHVHKFEAVIES